MQANKSNYQYSSKRNSHGIITQTADLVIVIPIILLALGLIATLIIGAFYKARLAIVSDMVALDAADLANTSETSLRGQVPTMVRNRLRQFGINTYQLTLHRPYRITINGTPPVDAVRVQYDIALPVIPGTILPNTVHLRDTSIALPPSNFTTNITAVAQVRHNDRDGVHSVYLPVVRYQPGMDTFYCDEPVAFDGYIGDTAY